jgi:hypothetical protein
MLINDILFSLEAMAAIVTLLVMGKLLIEAPFLSSLKDLFVGGQSTGYRHYDFDTKRSLMNQHIERRA